MKQFFIWLVLWYLRFLAKIALLIHKPTIIGIAGSVGKSSTRNAIHAILKDYYLLRVVGNSETGIPLGILEITPNGYTSKDWIFMLIKAPFGILNLQNIQYLIAEMGIDDPYPPKNMQHLLTIIKPDIAVSLNISAAHTMQFEKLLEGKKVDDKHQFLLEKIAEEDTKIITHSNCQIGIYNCDDENINLQMQNFKKSNTQTTLLTFGKDKDNSVSYFDYKVSTKGTEFIFTIKKQDKTALFTLTFPNIFLPKVYRETFAAAILVALNTNISEDQIKKSLEKNFTLPKGRASIFKGINNSLIIDSSYNSSTVAVLSFLELMEELKQQTKRPIVFLMGDMRELGEEAKIEHEKAAKKIVETVDYLYCVGPLTKEYVIPFVKNKKNALYEIEWFNNAKKAGEYLKNNLSKDALVLVKGSQNTLFLEEAIKYLLANKSDKKKLCRQEEFWQKIKSDYFKQA